MMTNGDDVSFYIAVDALPSAGGRRLIRRTAVRRRAGPVSDYTL